MPPPSVNNKILKISKSIGSFTISSTNSSTVTSPSMLCTEEDLLLMSFLASVGFFASIWGNLLRWGFSTLPKLSKLEILYWMMWTFWVLSGLEYSPAIKSATELDALVSLNYVFSVQIWESLVYLLKSNWFQHKKVHFVYSKLNLNPKNCLLEI